MPDIFGGDPYAAIGGSPFMGNGPAPIVPQGTAPPPGQAPAQPQAQPPQDDPSQDPMQLKLKAMVEKYLAFDPSKDPEIQAIRQKEGKDIDAQEKLAKGLLEDVHAFNYLDKPPPAPDITAAKKEMPEMRDFAVQNTPWLLMMMAIGGKVGKLTGGNMMGAMTGMMKGLQQGSKDKFDQAYKSWQDNWKIANDDWRNKMEVYRSQMEARKGKIDAEARAIQTYREVAGERETMAKNMTVEHSGYEKMMMALASSNAQLAAKRQGMEMREANERLKYWQEFRKVSGSFPRLTAAKEAMHRAYELTPYILQKYADAKKNESPMSPVPKTIGKWLISTSDPDVQNFAKDLADAKPILAALETSGTGSRSNMLLQQMISDTVPLNVYSLGPSEIQRLVQANVSLLDQAWSTQKQNMDFLRQMARQDVGLDIPEEPGYKFAPATTELGGHKTPSAGGTDNGPVVSLDEYLSKH